eukprot:m.35840 g.35840  ORF g.35840 m.35840 type:complete len:981 (-) comp9928_c0_seq3:227-3169(-)
MAFVQAQDRRKRSQRFSLLLLEHNGVYFNDFSALMLIGDRKEFVEGRLKVCSDCFAFDPKDTTLPIYKFPYRDCKDFVSSKVAGEDGFRVSTSLYVTMKELNIVKPWVQHKCTTPKVFAFTLKFTNSTSVVRQLRTLHDAWTDKSYAETQDVIMQIQREHRMSAQFNAAWLEDISETMLVETVASRVLPLTKNAGNLILTPLRIYFQPFNNIDSEPVAKFNTSNIRAINRRRFLLRNIGLELFFSDGSSLYLTFDTEGERDNFADTLLLQPTLQLADEDQKNMLIAWQNRAISNFDYLMYLNNLADRSFNDLAQYPVFPWIISDYKSESIDLTNPAHFRDLSKPIGALNPDRLAEYKKRFDGMPEPKFLYGTHYSTPGYVLYYTLRVAPEYSLQLQSGKFDQADRLFRSMAGTWQNVYEGMADVKELIPEFYMKSTSFLRNSQNLELGITQKGEMVADVELPPWAKDSTHFLEICREALESDYVSDNIHHWIDLIFGFKQRGIHAVRADNVFYYMTYEGQVDLDSIEDAAMRAATELQILEFGQTPRMLFSMPHPQRRPMTVERPLVHRGSSATPAVSALSSHASKNSVGAATSTPTSTSTSSTPLAGTSSRATSSTTSASAKNGEEMPKVEDAVESIAVVNLDPSDVLQPLVVHPDADSAKSSTVTPTHRSTQIMSWEHLDSDLHHVTSLPIHRDTIADVLFDADGSRIISIGQDSILRVHALSDHQQLFRVRVGDAQLSSVALLDDNDSVVVGSWDNNIYVVSLSKEEVVESWRAHLDAVSSIAICNKRLLSGSWNGTIKVWDLSTPNIYPSEEIALLQEHDCQITALDVHQPTNIAVSGAEDGLIVVWELEHFSSLRSLDIHFETISSLKIFPDGHRLLTATVECRFRVTELETGAQVWEVELDEDSEIQCTATNGTYALAGCMSGVLQLWDMNDGMLVRSFNSHRDPITGVCISNDANNIVTVDHQGNFTHWQGNV